MTYAAGQVVWYWPPAGREPPFRPYDADAAVSLTALAEGAALQLLLSERKREGVTA